MSMQTQWRVGMAGRTGLDYTAVRNGLELLGEEIDAETFRGITIMERAALATWAQGRNS